MKIRMGYWFCIIGLFLGVSGCDAREPATVGLSGIVYNYTQEGYVWIKINGETVGTTARKVEPGGVSGGGVMCCFHLPVGATHVEVELEPSLSDGYKTTATIEKWWPDLAHYGVVHILPGRKVVMEVTPSAPLPRRDLLLKQKRALGIKEKVLFEMWADGPIERTDGAK